MHLNEKTLDPVGRIFECRLDSSLHYLRDDNLNHLKKRRLLCELHRWANGKSEEKLMICKDCSVSLCLWCFCAFHEVKHVEKVR